MHWDNKHSFIAMNKRTDYEVAMLCLFKYIKYMFVIVTEYYVSCIYNLRRYVDRYFDESSYLPFRFFLNTTFRLINELIGLINQLTKILVIIWQEGSF